VSWSLKIGRIAGIDVYVHWTFSLLVIWFFLAQLFTGQGVVGGLVAVLFLCTIFLCVVLHELGHALTARHFGIRTRDITLMVLGGVARLERMPRNPVHEMLVAVAGPAVNVVIGAALLLAIVLRGSFGVSMAPEEAMGLNSVSQFLHLVFVANVVLVVFNALPAFPMDGGRVLRALLAMRLDYVEATQVAAKVGQAMAIAFALIGLLLGWWLLLFVAIFVFLGAQAEASATQTRDAFAGVPVGRAMVTRFTALPSDATLADAARELLAGTQPDFPVVEGEGVVGIVAQSDLVRALAGGEPGSPVTEVMRTDCLRVHADDMLDHVVERMQQSECPIALVMDDRELVGILTQDNLTEFLMLQQARRRRRTPPAGA